MTKEQATRKALKLALEALEFNSTDDEGSWKTNQDAITAIKEALQSNEQVEPVAWMDPDDIGADTAFKWFQTKQFKQPVYTKPQPSQKPLTDAHLYLESLVDALDGAFISTWQSTCAWQTQLDEARNYLIFHGIKE